MKKFLFLILSISLILNSCKKSPVAGFHTNTVEPEVGQTVFFYNESQDASRFEWDFGDGYTSNEANPDHVYNATGTYDVKLKAVSKGSLADEAYLTLTVMVPTLLEIQVLEYYNQYAVPGASIILYPSLVDWDAQTNKVTEGFTDQNGIAVFGALDPYVYYVDVWEQNHDNYTLRTEDVGFIRTPEVIPHQINQFIAYVDSVPHAKGAAKGVRSLIIRKMERKVIDRPQMLIGIPKENWKKLYDRRVNKN